MDKVIGLFSLKSALLLEMDIGIFLLLDCCGSGGVDQKIKNLPIPSGRFFKVPAVECTPNEENLYTD